MFDFLKKQCVLCVIGGAVAGIVGYKVVSAKKTRQLAVKTLAKGLQTKDVIDEKVANFREDAEDIYACAKEEAKKASEPVEVTETEEASIVEE